MEIELKYACPSGAVLREILAAQPGEPRIIEMATDYYDTADRFLRSRHWTLRIRKENGEAVACCKTRGNREGALSSHGEWECRASELPEAIPQLVAQGAPAELLALTGLERFCGAAFTRKSVDVILGETVIELSCDEGHLLGLKEREALCEVELELKAGPLEPMLAFGAQLQEKYGLKEEPRSKLARAMELK